MASEDFAARLKSLITRFGFRPDEVSVSNRFGVGTISFKNQKGKATELVSKLRGAMKQSGVPESAITAREVQYPADEDLPAEHWGVVNVDFSKMPHSRLGAKAKFKVEDRFYFGKGRKERFADDVYLDFRDALHIAYDLQKVVGSMKPMGESRMDAAIVQALGQLTKISARLQQPRVSSSTLNTMMRQVDGLAKQFRGLWQKYSAESRKLKDKSSGLRRSLPSSGTGKPFPLGSLESREYTRQSRELGDSQKNIENLFVLMQEAWRIENALASIAKRYL